MKQITEDYVSFETAKLLKEKGFDAECYDFYEQEICGVYDYDVTTPQPKHSQKYNSTNWNNEDDDNSVTCSRPSQALALKWLREVHKIHIDVFIGSDESYDADGVMVDEWHFWTYYITNTSGDMIYDAYNEVDVIEYQTHEEAVEAALKYTLENLI